MTARTISRDEARQLDRRAVDDFGMPSILLMENAGRGVADCLGRLGAGGGVTICCGPGNNGGDGYVIARHLDLRGYAVRVLVFCAADRIQGDAATNYRILAASGVPIEHLQSAAGLAARLAGSSWIVDALLGTGATGEPRPPLDAVIATINTSRIAVLSVDLPSGLDCETGRPASHTIRATHTCTFVAAKPGFVAAGAKDYLGVLHVVDIGAPRKLIEEYLGPP